MGARVEITQMASSDATTTELNEHPDAFDLLVDGVEALETLPEVVENEQPGGTAASIDAGDQKGGQAGEGAEGGEHREEPASGEEEQQEEELEDDDDEADPRLAAARKRQADRRSKKVRKTKNQALQEHLDRWSAAVQVNSPTGFWCFMCLV